MQQLHDQMRLAIGPPPGTVVPTPGATAGSEKIDIEADVQHAVACLYPLVTRRIETPTPNSSIARHVGDRDAAIATGLFQADRSTGFRTDRADRTDRDRGASPSRPSRPGSPQRNAADMPCMLPVTVVAGVCSRRGRRVTARNRPVQLLQ